MASNPKDICLKCQIKRHFKCMNSYYLDEHIPEPFRQSIKECIPDLKKHDIKLKDFIRHGLFGCVCSAKMNGVKVAVKVVIDRNHANFNDEFNIIKQFNHINVINILEELKMGHTKFMVMPLATYDLKGFLLFYVNKRKKLLSESNIRILFSAIVSGVAHIHQKGYAHKDIKLLNILLMNDYMPKISDFDCIEYCYEDTGRLKYKTIRTGTNSYLAPEIIHEKPVNDLRKVDVWALGVVFFEMLFLRTPFIPSGTKHTERHKYLSYVDNNQFERNIPQNPSITLETMNLLNRLLVNNFWRRDGLNVIMETEPWFKRTLHLPKKRRSLPPITDYSIYYRKKDKNKKP